MTAEELLRYRREPYRHELLAGMLHEVQPPGAEHGFVASRMARLLMLEVDEAYGIVFTGEIGFHIATDPDTVRGPDVSFVAADRIPRSGIPAGYWPGPPDLAVEVVSPTDRWSQVDEKALVWLDAGTRVVLVLDPPNKTVTVYRSRRDIRVLAGDEPLALDDVVPGFAPRTGDLFA